VDTSDKFYEEEDKYLNRQYPEAMPYMQGFSLALLDSPFKREIDAEYGEFFLKNIKLGVDSFSEKNIQLMQEENELVDRYQRIMASCKISFEGEECNLYGIKKYFSSPDRNIRKAAWKKYSEFFSSHEKEMGEIFDKLVKIRNQMGENMGFENFIKLGYMQQGRLDYDEKNVAEFRRQVEEVLVPFCSKLYEAQAKRIGVEEIECYDEEFIFPDGNAVPVGNRPYLVEQAKKMYRDMSRETGEFIDFMLGHELMDLDNKPNKASTGYMTYLADYKAPFVFSCFNGTTGDVDVLLLDKTGTITLGNRQASEFIPVGDTSESDLAAAAQLSSIADETAEGRSIVVLAKNRFGMRGKEIAKLNAKFIEFTAKTRMSGVDIGDVHIRKGSADAIKAYVQAQGGVCDKSCDEIVERVANEGGTPLLVAQNEKILGVVYLKDVVKEGVKEKFEDLRKIGIKTIMITGDNPMTAAAIAAEAGVDDFVAEATPETKLALIKKLQEEGHLVAMTGDGTNDAPALAQADVAVAMDSSPTKLIEVVRIGKQLLMTRGALTTFSIANDIAKYFAIIPVLFAGIYPGLEALNFMRLTSPTTAILSSVLYNALIIVALIPLSLKGVRYKEQPAGKMLKHNLLIYGVGGVIAPFLFIKCFDLLLTVCGVA